VRRLVIFLAALLSLAVTAPAAAEIVLAQDNEGRTIRFDVQVPGVNVEWYAELLRNAAHDDEITRVTIRIVSADDLRFICGAGAGGCYAGSSRSARIVVPAGQSARIAHTLLHEYGHHVDASTPVPGVREPNGTPRWWVARDMTRLLARGEVAHNYSRGWERAIGEIFAEDYVRLHLQTPSLIRWLPPPDETVLEALRADLSGAPAEPAPAPAPTTPLVVTRTVALAPGRVHALPFGLLGPGRRVTFTARLAVVPVRAQGRMEVRCDGAVVAARRLVRGHALTIDLPNRGPAVCRAVARNTGRTPIRAALRLRLAIESPRPIRAAAR
jgi:hypothetical protein